MNFSLPRSIDKTSAIGTTDKIPIAIFTIDLTKNFRSKYPCFIATGIVALGDSDLV